VAYPHIILLALRYL